eukprot:gene5097-biopygen4158
MAPLPDTRVVRTRPFQHTGVDFAGPLYVKMEKGKTSKAYIALFTCATTRAVNLELVEDMTVSTFKLALERFIAAWGVPNLIISDNSSTFRATTVDLHQLYEHPEVQACLANNYITWKFNLALALWWRGWFEKMAGLTKGILRRCLGKAMLRFREMQVVLKKVQAILNNHPLCYQGEELEEESMTPNHLIFGHRLVQMPDIPNEMFEEQDDDRVRFKHIEARLNSIRDRWQKEYLLGLREFHKQRSNSQGTDYRLKPEDIVQIEKKGVHRGMWKKGSVLKLLTGKNDTVARGVALEVTINGNKRKMERAVQQVYPLELVAEVHQKHREPVEPVLRRSSRMAAKNAKAIISTIEEVNQEDLN